ncbi:MAG: rhomboid family intramembrane serine protease [Chlorobi bacterium]|nr:rhomboid family intramembrane serine protease [Chlorobiota bacterium]
MFLALIWAIKIFEVAFDFKLVFLGLYPHKTSGLIGIFTAPLIHGGFNHLFSNSLPILILGTTILYFYPKSAKAVIAGVYLLPGIFVWFFGRESYHIGASGMIYGFVTFLFFSGVIKRDRRSIAISLIVTFLYGGLIWGVLPVKEGISWEYHLFGAIWGIIFAIVYRKKDKFKQYDWEDEEDDVPPDELEISYDKEDPF